MTYTLANESISTHHFVTAPRPIGEEKSVHYNTTVSLDWLSMYLVHVRLCETAQKQSTTTRFFSTKHAIFRVENHCHQLGKIAT